MQSRRSCKFESETVTLKMVFQNFVIEDRIRLCRGELHRNTVIVAHDWFMMCGSVAKYCYLLKNARLTTSLHYESMVAIVPVRKLQSPKATIKRKRFYPFANSPQKAMPVHDVFGRFSKIRIHKLRSPNGSEMLAGDKRRSCKLVGYF